jgi:hypothetical protein
MHACLCSAVQLKSGYAAPVTNEDGTEGSAQIDEVATLVCKFHKSLKKFRKVLLH